MVRFEVPLFFANATVFEEAVQKAVRAGATATPAVHDLVLDLEAVTDIDVTDAESFHSVRERLDAHQVVVHYSRLRPDLRAELAHFGLLDGVEVFATNRDSPSPSASPSARSPLSRPS